MGGSVREKYYEGEDWFLLITSRLKLHQCLVPLMLALCLFQGLCCSINHSQYFCTTLADVYSAHIVAVTIIHAYTYIQTNLYSAKIVETNQRRWYMDDGRNEQQWRKFLGIHNACRRVVTRSLICKKTVYPISVMSLWSRARKTKYNCIIWHI